MAEASSQPPQDPGDKRPGAYRAFVERFPELGEAHERISEHVAASGPLDAKSQALVKLGMAIGAGQESTVRAHTRRAMQAGASEAELEQAAALAMTTLGFPRTVAAWQWIRQQIDRGA